MGGSSGGGSSGAVSWPQWISEIHRDGANYMLASIQSTFNPFKDIRARDPQEVLSWMFGELNNWHGIIDNFDPATGWETSMYRVGAIYKQFFLDPATVEYITDQHYTAMRKEFEGKVLPTFHAGMRDINAVQSSGFIVGEAILEGFFLDQSQKFGEEFMAKQYDRMSSDILSTAGKLLEPKVMQLQAYNDWYHHMLDSNRIALIAFNEYTDKNLEINEAEQRWELEKWNSYGNYIASMNGGTVHTTGRKPSTTQSILGGAFSGAATGVSMGGGWWGAAGGAVLGAGAALASR